MVIALNEKLSARGQLQTSRIFQVVVSFFLIYESALAAIAGTHISPPGNLNCALRETWEKIFSEKDQQPIKRIQDAFQCCGLMSMKDKAWPFPDATHDANACMVKYEERSRACLDPWRDEERKVAIMLLVSKAKQGSLEPELSPSDRLVTVFSFCRFRPYPDWTFVRSILTTS